MQYTIKRMIGGLVMAGTLGTSSVPVAAQNIEALERDLDSTIRAACHSYMVDAIPDALSWLRKQIYQGSPFCRNVETAYDEEAIGKLVEVEYVRARSTWSELDLSKKQERGLNITIECDGEYMCIESRMRFLGTSTPVTQKQFNQVYDYCGERYGCTQAFFDNWPQAITKSDSVRGQAATEGLAFGDLLPSPVTQAPSANAVAVGSEPETAQALTSLPTKTEENLGPKVPRFGSQQEIKKWLTKHFEPITPYTAISQSCGDLPKGWEPKVKTSLPTIWFEGRVPTASDWRRRVDQIDAYADCVERAAETYDVGPYSKFFPALKRVHSQWRSLGGKLTTYKYIPSDGFIYGFASPAPEDVGKAFDTFIVMITNPNAEARIEAARSQDYENIRRREAAQKRIKDTERRRANTAAMQRMIQSYGTQPSPAAKSGPSETNSLNTSLPSAGGTASFGCYAPGMQVCINYTMPSNSIGSFRQRCQGQGNQLLSQCRANGPSCRQQNFGGTIQIYNYDLSRTDVTKRECGKLGGTFIPR